MPVSAELGRAPLDVNLSAPASARPRTRLFAREYHPLARPDVPLVLRRVAVTVRAAYGAPGGRCSPLGPGRRRPRLDRGPDRAADRGGRSCAAGPDVGRPLPGAAVACPPGSTGIAERWTTC